MIIDSFTPAWFLMFGFQILLIVLFSLIGKKRNKDQKKKFMIGYYIFMCIFYVCYKAFLVLTPNYETTVLEELPFALCQVASLLCLPAILSEKRTLLGFVFFVSSLCSLMALLMPSPGFGGIPLLSGMSIGYYGFHGLVFVQGILVYTLGFYRPRGNDVLGIIALLAGLALAAHLINFLIRSTTGVEANYFFTYDPEGNPILMLFRDFLDLNYLYLIPLLPPIGFLLWLLALLFREQKKK